MKTQSDIEDRIRFLLCEELSRRVREAETRLPHLCVYNHRQPLDTRKAVEDLPNETYNRISQRDGEAVRQTMGLCMLGAENPEQWPGNICEDPIDAQRCPYFTPLASKASIYESFQTQVRDVDWVAVNMPELYGLLWALDASTAYRIPWWKRLWFKLVRINLAPVLSNYDVVALLPPAPSGGPPPTGGPG
jgi:hypothetical protein